MKSHPTELCEVDVCGLAPYMGPKVRWHHRFRQSWLKNATRCLEYARREHEKVLPRVESDATSVGTAVHAAIETCLEEHHDGCALTLASTLEVFHDAFSELMQDPTFVWIKRKEAGARSLGTRCVRAWYQEVLPTLSAKGVLEKRFMLPFHEDEHRIVELSGTIDYISGDTTHGPALKDWKTSGGKPWEAWEHERWDVQPTVYTWAAVQLECIGDVDLIDGAYPFEFVVLGGKNNVDRITVVRTKGDWNWLEQKCVEIAELVELQLPRWPTNDTHALCSPKWCTAWDTCKGAHVSAGWPKGA